MTRQEGPLSTHSICSLESRRRCSSVSAAVNKQNTSARVSSLPVCKQGCKLRATPPCRSRQQISELERCRAPTWHGRGRPAGLRLAEHHGCSHNRSQRDWWKRFIWQRSKARYSMKYANPRMRGRVATGAWTLFRHDKDNSTRSRPSKTE